MPPGVIAVLLLFSRHHNYIAERLFDINESGKYKAWDQLDEAGKKWQDEDIFQLTRNINVAFFAKVSPAETRIDSARGAAKSPMQQQHLTWRRLRVSRPAKPVSQRGPC